MNQSLPPAELFESAARLVERALDALDDTGGPCTCCGTRLFNNRVEAKVCERLRETPRKLRDASRDLRMQEMINVPRCETRETRTALDGTWSRRCVMDSDHGSEQHEFGSWNKA